MLNRRLLFIFLAAILIVGAWNFNEPKRQRPSPAAAVKQQEVDAYLLDAQITQFTATGSTQYQLQATRVSHFPDSGRTLLDSPQLIHYRQSKTPLTITAGDGELSPSGDRISFRRGVTLTGLNGGARVNSETLHIDPQRQQADTDSRVIYSHPQGRFEGTGLRANLRDERVQLLHDVRGHYVKP